MANTGNEVFYSSYVKRFRLTGYLIIMESPSKSRYQPHRKDRGLQLLVSVSIKRPSVITLKALVKLLAHDSSESEIDAVL